MCGTGRVGIGVDSRTPGYQIAQRSDFFEVEVGLETTLKRPIINTRDEPHAVADKYRRLHVIIGDANHCRRRQPPEDGHHLAGPGDDRGRRPSAPDLSVRAPGRHAARDLARPDAADQASSSSTAAG